MREVIPRICLKGSGESWQCDGGEGRIQRPSEPRTHPSVAFLVRRALCADGPHNALSFASGDRIRSLLLHSLIGEGSLGSIEALVDCLIPYENLAVDGSQSHQTQSSFGYEDSASPAAFVAPSSHSFLPSLKICIKAALFVASDTAMQAAWFMHFRHHKRQWC